jgi:Cu/Ag efflux protein CusF
MAAGVSVLTVLAAANALADQAATAPAHEKTCTGTVVSIDPKERVLEVKGVLLSKKFNLGENCVFTFLGKGTGKMDDLRPGQKMRISYQNVHGVLVADRVTQEAMRSEGTVKSVNPDQRTLTLHFRALDKTFRIADDCKVVLRDAKSGTLADVEPGHHVTVTYETPNGTATARQIAQTSATFTGTLTAIDLPERTVKAKATFDAKKFNLADGCTIVLNGKTGGQMRDLRPGEKLTFSYDDVNGINIVNRIANAEAPAELATAKPAK